MRTTPRGRALARVAGGTLVVAALTVVCVYVVWMAYLAVFADEGALPPLHRIPIPADAVIVGDTEECASGGCWREVTIQPAPGTTARDLAEQMGLSAGEERLPWGIRDPHSVAI